MRLLADTLFIVGLSFVAWGAFTLATWFGLLTVGGALCLIGWWIDARLRKKLGEDKPK